MNKVMIYLVFLAGCTITNIRVHNQEGSTCTVDASISANPQVDPNIDLPPFQEVKLK